MSQPRNKQGRWVVQAIAAALDEPPNMAMRDADRQIIEPPDIQYTMHTDNGLASDRSKYLARTHADVKAAQIGPLPSGLGLSLRMRMPHR